MAFLTVNAAEVEKEGQGGSFFSTSGLYPVTLRAVEIAGTTNGATQANYYFKEGNSFGNTIINKAGEPIFGFRILEALAALLGESTLSDPEATSLKFKSQTKKLMCIPELIDVEVNVWVQYEYRRYQGEIKEDIHVKRFYRSEDSASGSEVLKGENFGAQLKKDLKYIEEVKYSDGVTAEEVTEWKEAQKTKNGKTGGATAGAAAKSNFPGAAAKSNFPGAAAASTGAAFPGAT